MMKPLKCIAAVNQAGGIGKNGRLLYHLHEDMRRFHDLTVHQRIICGHHTLTSFPHGKPLSDRENLILSHDASLTIEDARIMHSLQELFLYLSETEDKRDVFVCGGGSIYDQLLSYCDTLYLTVIYDDREADAFFPIRDEGWAIDFKSSLYHEKGMDYRFMTLKKAGSGSIIETEDKEAEIYVNTGNR
ncbi:MAG: dihydrofolate reductase [Solobacterium sp.]|jgi:dihydrofolate reductase|nr:dihydrofolate reductase [Solobacterium sp.]MCH4049631.1 dihydrofolate reductase [Solobacterium sp.]MCH4073316.1 dihydrofolate reductase [Solobacterium sp.]MCI1313126.1 dihydrofolate reductase [Solobacterium sp.]MCI1345444.1 dihydrofolate reductase [Solobacterium sp.]